MLDAHHYQILYEVLRDIYLMENDEELAGYILIQVSRALQTNGGTIFLVKADRLYPTAATGAPLSDLQKYDFKIGEGIVGTVAKTRASLIVEDASNDPRFCNTVDVKTGFITRNIVAAPIVYGQKLHGVIEFLNKVDGTFKPTDQEFIALLGKVVGLALEGIHLHQELTKSEKLKQAAIESLSAGMVIVDPYMNMLLTNSRAAQILGKNIQSLKLGDSIMPLRETVAGIIGCIQKVLLSKSAINRQEGVFSISGVDKKIGYSCVPVSQKDGALFGAALLFQDITSFGQP